MASCNFLTRNLIPSCEALQAVGGVNLLIRVGQLDDIDTITFGADGEIVTFSLLTGKSLKAFSGKKEKHQGTYELTAGETVNLFNQSAILALYFRNDAERSAVNELVNSENMFAFLQTNDGVIEAYGISNKALLDFASFGLEATAGTGNGTGVLINDDKVYRVTLSSNVPNLPMTYKPADTLANNLIGLNSITFPNLAP
jgi:hypothetical protein